jgi:alpha-ketoglutarate-dependent taurine dioxygenase
MTSLTFVPLTGTLGAEVSGVDLHQRLDDATIAEIRAALLRHRVLFFRDQLLSPQELVAFGERFGPLTPAHPVVPSLDGHPEVLAVDSTQVPARVRARDRAAGDAKWHTDVTFSETPPLGSLLNAHTIPPRGGDTLWSDLVDAYDSLSAPLRALLTELEAVHDGRQVFGYFARDESGSGARERLQQLKPVRHPVVRVHPETFELGLFVNPTFTSHIAGLSPRESAALLELLYDQIAHPERTVRWRWRVGDLAFWDNRATAHYATLDYGDAPRRLHRITLVGDRPYGPRAGVVAPSAELHVQ